MTSGAIPKGPLEGVKVLEIAEGVAGPYCGKLLAGLGADVVKLERPATGDKTRHLPPFVCSSDANESSALFLNLNTGKRSVAVDIRCVEGQQLLAKLIGTWADVIISSERPSEATALSVDWKSVKQMKASAVLVSVTDFGQTGPYREYAGTELVNLALGGYLYLTGDPEREPLKPYGHQAEYHAGLHAATGAVAGILRAEITGEGDQVDASAVEAAAFLSSAAPGWAYFYGEDPTRVGNRLANLDPKQFYPSTMRPCRDGWVHAHGNTRSPELLEVLMGDPRLSQPHLLAEPKGNADEIDMIMDEWLAEHDKREVVELAQLLRVPFTEVLTPEEVLEDPHLNERGALVSMEHPTVGTATLPGAPVRFSVTPWHVSRPPLLGEHTYEFVHEALKLDADELARLRAQGVLG